MRSRGSWDHGINLTHPEPDSLAAKRNLPPYLNYFKLCESVLNCATLGGFFRVAVLFKHEIICFLTGLRTRTTRPP